MLYPPGFYYVKKPKRFVILSSDKSSERNLSCFFDIKKPRRIEHLESEEPFSSDPYFSIYYTLSKVANSYWHYFLQSITSWLLLVEEMMGQQKLDIILKMKVVTRPKIEVIKVI